MISTGSGAFIPAFMHTVSDQLGRADIEVPAESSPCSRSLPYP